MRRHAEVSHEAAKLATTGFRKKTAVRREGYSLAEGGNTQGRQGHVFTETNVRKAPEKIVAGYTPMGATEAASKWSASICGIEREKKLRMAATSALTFTTFS